MSIDASVTPAVHRFTRDEYHRMATTGLFADQRVELLDGEIIIMSPKLTSHSYAVTRLMYTLIPAFGAGAIVRVQDPVVLNDRSEPEPDLVVCQADPGQYKQAHPRADQVLLIIEVADSSLSYDRTRKAKAYAQSSIPEYWIVNLQDRQIEVLTEPIPQSSCYRQQRLVLVGDRFTLSDGSSLLVDDIIP